MSNIKTRVRVNWCFNDGTFMNASREDDFADDDWADEELHHDELPDDEDVATIDCPACQREIYDDAFQCPHCGHYISEAEHAGGSKPAWIVITIVLCLAMILFWIFGPAL